MPGRRTSRPRGKRQLLANGEYSGEELIYQCEAQRRRHRPERLATITGGSSVGLGRHRARGDREADEDMLAGRSGGPQSGVPAPMKRLGARGGDVPPRAQRATVPGRPLTDGVVVYLRQHNRTRRVGRGVSLCGDTKCNVVFLHWENRSPDKTNGVDLVGGHDSSAYVSATRGGRCGRDVPRYRSRPAGRSTIAGRRTAGGGRLDGYRTDATPR